MLPFIHPITVAHRLTSTTAQQNVQEIKDICGNFTGWGVFKILALYAVKDDAVGDTYVAVLISAEAGKAGDNSDRSYWVLDNIFLNKNSPAEIKELLDFVSDIKLNRSGPLPWVILYKNKIPPTHDLTDEDAATELRHYITNGESFSTISEQDFKKFL